MTLTLPFGGGGAFREVGRFGCEAGLVAITTHSHHPITHPPHHPTSLSTPPFPLHHHYIIITHQIREFLEKHYAETSGRDTVKLAIRALMETVEASSKSIEVSVMERGGGLRLLGDEELDALVAKVEADKAAAEAAKRGRGGGGGGEGAGPSGS